MTWTLNNIHIPYYICDYTDHLSLQFLSRIFQDAADNHTEHFHMGFTDLMANGKAWVLSRVYYKVHNMPNAMDRVNVTTWSRRADRLCAMRDTEMRDLQDNLLVASTSMWVIMDMQKRTVVRMLDDIVNFDHERRLATDRDVLQKLTLPTMDDRCVVSHFKATHANIDHNLHVNNTDYIRWIVDAIKFDLNDTERIDTLEIDYFHETRLGDDVWV
ncbi:MAG: thioesterase, partial [Bacteroidales bacterium]|nr:thioesterase [Bacteroidales bacterium]